MSGLAILGYAVITLGVIVGIWGGAANPLNLTNNASMSYLLSAGALITAGLAAVSSVPKWLLLTALWATAAVALVYFFGFQWQGWVFAMCAAVVVAIAGWFTVPIVKR